MRALAGPRPSAARVAARSASSPIRAPEPSSPRVKPRPPTMVSLPATRAIAAEPVPAMTRPPSSPACAPMQAVVASLAARTSANPGKAATTASASPASLSPARPRPMATPGRSDSPSPALPRTSPTTPRRTSTAAAKSTWMFAAAPVASARLTPAPSRSRPRHRVAPPSTPMNMRGVSLTPGSAPGAAGSRTEPPPGPLVSPKACVRWHATFSPRWRVDALPGLASAPRGLNAAVLGRDHPSGVSFLAVLRSDERVYRRSNIATRDVRSLTMNAEG